MGKRWILILFLNSSMLLLLFLLFAATQTVVISSISNDLVGGEINLLDAGIVDVLGLYRVMFNQTTKGNETDDLFPLQSVNRSAEITAIFSNLTLFEGNQTSSTQSIVDIGYTFQYFGTLTSPSPLKEVFFQIFGINVDDAFIDEFRQRISRNRDSSFQQIIENMKKKGDTRKARLQLKSFFGSSFEVSTIIDHTLSDDYCIFGAQVFQTFPLLAVEIKETLLPSRFTVMFTRLVGFYNQGQYFINTILQHLQLILLPLFFLRALEILQSDFQLKLQKLFDQTSFTGVSIRKSSNLVSTSMKPNLDVIRQQSFTVRQELLNDLKWFKIFFDQTNDDLRLEYHELYEMTSYALHFLRFCYDPTSLPTNKGDYALTSPLETVSNFYYSWETLQPYQYGLAPTSYPLRAAIRRFFALPTKYHKVFVIITDGRGWNNQNDDSKVIDLAHNFQHKEEVLLINCYLSSEKEEVSMKQELYYHKNTNNWSLTEQSLFERSSEVRLKTAAVLLLERMGWIVPQEGRCRLFIRTNLVSVLKFAVSLTRIISENRHQIIYDKMVHVANFARKIDHYHSSFVAPRQIGGTCYAYALAAVIYLNSARVIGRPSLNFHDLVEEIIMANIQSKKSLPDFEGESDSELRDGGNMNFLQSFPSLKRLRWAEVSEFEARKAVLSGRVVLTIFGLTQTRWNQFSRIYSDPTAKGTVITDIGEAGSQYDHSSHAVVLVDAEPDHLKFMNSWGSSWADNGCFRVSTLPEYDLMSIMRFHFFDVYWEPEDLNEDEKLAYQHLYNHLFS